MMVEKVEGENCVALFFDSFWFGLIETVDNIRKDFEKVRS